MEANARDELAMFIPNTVAKAADRPRAIAVSATTAMEAPGLITSAAAIMMYVVNVESNIWNQKTQ